MRIPVARFFSQGAGIEIKVGPKTVKRGDFNFEEGRVFLRIFREGSSVTFALTPLESFRLSEKIDEFLEVDERKDEILFDHSSSLLSVHRAPKWIGFCIIKREDNEKHVCWLLEQDAAFLSFLASSFAEKAAYERRIGPALEVSPPEEAKTEEIEEDVPIDVESPSDFPVEDIPSESVFDAPEKEVKDAN